MTLTFNDGFVAAFDLQELRTSCPCAVCRDRRSAGEEVGPPAGAPLTIVDVRLVGGWGLGFQWSDGHETGIFPFELLRRWREGDSEA